MKISNSPRNLNTSPTQASLGINKSTVSLSEIPPLISINSSQFYQNINPLNRHQNVDNVTNQVSKASKQIPFLINNKKVKEQKHLNKETINDKETKIINKKSHQNKQSSKMSKINQKIKASKFIYNTKLKNKQSNGLLNENRMPVLSKSSKQLFNYNQYSIDDQQHSIAQSVYLDLQQYSSIHKYQSASPYDLEEQQKQYAKYFQDNRQYQQNKMSRNRKQISSIRQNQQDHNLDDTYNQFMEDQSMTPKIHRMQSTGLYRNQQLLLIEENGHKPEFYTQRNFIKNSRQINKQNYVSKFNKIQEESQNKSQSKQQNKTINFWEMTKNIFKGLQNFPANNLSNNLQYDEFSINNVPIVVSQKNVVKISEPDWMKQKSASSVLKLILIKPHRLQNFLIFNIQNKIYLYDKHHKQQHTQIGQRFDVGSNNLINQSKQSYKVHYNNQSYETEYLNKNNQLASNFNKFSKMEKEKINKSIVKSNIYLAQQLIIQQHPNQKSQTNQKFNNKKKLVQNRQEGKSKQLDLAKSSVTSSGKQSLFNILGLKRNKQVQKQKYRLQQMPSKYQNEGVSQNFQIKQMSQPILRQKGKLRDIQVLNLLETLLIKLSTKKCNVFTKETEQVVKNSEFNLEKQRNRNYLTDSRKIFNSNVFSTSELSNGVRPNNIEQSSAKFKVNLGQNMGKITKIEFQQFIQQNQKIESGEGIKKKQIVSTKLKMITYSQKIRQLNRILQAKEQYLVQIKSSYDYVINNYINSIANIKTIPLNSQQKIPSLNFLQFLKVTKDGANFNLARNNQKQEQQSEDYIVSNKVNELKPIQYNKTYEDGGQNVRLSQPMTFQMSMQGNQNSVQQQWVGNSPSNQQQNQNIRKTNQDETTQLRRSLPSKQQVFSHQINNPKSKQLQF